MKLPTNWSTLLTYVDSFESNEGTTMYRYNTIKSTGATLNLDKNLSHGFYRGKTFVGFWQVYLIRHGLLL